MGDDPAGDPRCLKMRMFGSEGLREAQGGRLSLTWDRGTCGGGGPAQQLAGSQSAAFSPRPRGGGGNIPEGGSGLFPAISLFFWNDNIVPGAGETENTAKEGEKMTFTGAFCPTLEGPTSVGNDNSSWVGPLGCSPSFPLCAH